MIDFLVVCYFMFGLFYAGKKFEKICSFVVADAEEPDRVDMVLVFVLILLTIVAYPFVMGIESKK